MYNLVNTTANLRVILMRINFVETFLNNKHLLKFDAHLTI